MNTAASIAAAPGAGLQQSKPQFDSKPSRATVTLFIALLVGGALFTAYSLMSDVKEAGVHPTSYLPFFLLGVALLIALGFEFVNGFHDTANAVATVIYTHSLAPNMAVGDGPASGTLSAGRRPAAPRPSASFSRRPASCFWTAEPAPAFPR